MEIKLCSLVFILIFSYSASVDYPYSGNGETPEHWNDIATKELKKAKQMKPNIAVANNVILFLGDGMGVSTVTAARILKGQLKYKSGEEELLSFEEFPNVGLSKTYTQDAQTADSAGTATAYFAGVKTNLGALGCDARTRRGVCSSMVPGSELTNILDWSLAAGKSVGIVTTTRVTHATPAALYARTPERYWEHDADMVNVTGGCKDIASQLVDDNIDIHVVLGGGRMKFLKNNTMDPQSGLLADGRMDGRDLTQVWQEKQAYLRRSHQYVWNRTAFNKVDPAKTDYLFGLFNKDNMDFEIDRQQEPSLDDMTDKAIQILRKNPKGYFLLVEGGRIDHGHHESLARKALHDTLAFDKAVMKGVAMTSEKDSLIITTADHSHTLTIGGYPTRGNPLFGLTDDWAGGNMLGLDKKPYTTLSYANGPGAYAEEHAVVRPNLTHVNTAGKEYKQQSNVPLIRETHSGEDVAIYAQGPMAHLFHGVHEQHYIAHVMAYASCVGDYASADKCAASEVARVNAGNSFKLNLVFCSFIILVKTFILC